MIVGDFEDLPLVEFLLCAADLARQGFAAPLTECALRIGVDPVSYQCCIDARHEAMAVSPRVFSYRNDLLADTILEAAYRVASGHGVGVVS